MSTELPDFNRAEYIAEPEAQLAPAYEYKGGLGAQEVRDEFPKALLFGTVAAILGALVYAAFTIVTHITLGIVALFLGAFIAKAMLRATDSAGGRKYQIAAVVFTYLSISMAVVIELLWEIHLRGMNISHISARGYVILTRAALESPFLELKESSFNGLIGLFIIFFAMQIAWKTAAGKRTNE
jgi:hypothetical protein